jgi:hypothetical protein
MQIRCVATDAVRLHSSEGSYVKPSRGWTCTQYDKTKLNQDAHLVQVQSDLHIPSGVAHICMRDAALLVGVIQENQEPQRPDAFP